MYGQFPAGSKVPCESCAKKGHLTFSVGVTNAHGLSLQRCWHSNIWSWVEVYGAHHRDTDASNTFNSLVATPFGFLHPTSFDRSTDF